MVYSDIVVIARSAVSSFCGVDMTGAWKVWMADPNIKSAAANEKTPRCIYKSSLPCKDIMSTVQTFVIILYNATSSLSTVNECGRFL